MSEQNGGPSKALIDRGLRQALIDNGYILEDGTVNRQSFRERLCDYLGREAKVLAKGERVDKAKTKGTCTVHMFPESPQPTDDTDILAKEVWKEQVKFVWNELRTSADQPLQRMVGINMGNGYVLCRTKIGRDAVDAVYITDNHACIKQDFTRPENEALARKTDTARKNREMLMLRQPEHAEDYAKEYDATIRAALAAGNAQLQLTLEALRNDEDIDDADDESGDDGE